MNQHIKIRITPEGRTTIDAINYQGTDCQEATLPYQRALGLTTADHAKPELYESARNTTTEENKA